MENKNLYEKLLEVKKEVEFIQKKKVGDNLTYKAITSSMILGAINKELNKLGILLKTQMLGKDVQRLERTKSYENPKTQKVTLTTVYDFIATIDLEYTWINTNNTSEKDANLFSCSGLNTDPSKAFGSALTYAEKYFMMKYFNVATDEYDVDTFKQLNEDEDEKKERAEKLEAEKAEKERIALEKKEAEKLALEKLETEKKEQKRKEFLNKISLSLKELVKDGLISLSSYYEYIKTNLTDKRPNLLNDVDFNKIVEHFAPKPQVNENKASQIINKFDKCNTCRNEVDFCICDIDKKVVEPVSAKV